MSVVLVRVLTARQVRAGHELGRMVHQGKERFMVEGTLIAESIRVGAELSGARFVARKIYRTAAGDVSAGQPELWTFIEFEADEQDAEALAGALANVLDRQHGWYADFRTPDQTYVIFSGRVFRYPRGDGPGRDEAADYARSVGVPEPQLDWPV